VEFYRTSQQFVAIVTIISTPTDPAVKTDKQADYAIGVYCLQIALFYVIHLIYLAVKILQQEMSGSISLLFTNRLQLPNVRTLYISRRGFF
jgi:hypothetical protein